MGVKTKIKEGHTIKGDWILVHVSDILTPKPGRICYGPAWWTLTDDDEVLFFRSYASPQCNSNKTIVERFASKDAPNIRYLEIAYIPHCCSDY